jgi:hypothetical protein
MGILLPDKKLFRLEFQSNVLCSVIGEIGQGDRRNCKECKIKYTGWKRKRDINCRKKELNRTTINIEYSGNSFIFNLIYKYFADHRGRAVNDTNSLRPLKHWGHGFESLSRH